jgi:hypothetical protein
VIASLVKSSRRMLAAACVLALAAVSACDRAPVAPGPGEVSTTASGGRRVGGFKGYVVIDQQLRQRVVSPDRADLHLSRYLGSYNDEFSGLVALLGGFAGPGGSSEFRNGDPNAMNMLLWELALGALAGDIAKNCAPPLAEGTVPLSSSFAARLAPLCSWPDASAKTEANLQALWTGLMGFSAPPTEFAAWRDYFLGADSPYAQTPAAEAVEAMLTGIMLNPHFLLEH